MSDFGNKVLSKLLDKYENSVISKNGSLRNIKISLSLKDKELKSYTCRSSYDFREANDAVLSFYEQKGFIIVKKDPYDTFESLYLNIENVNLVYDFLKRINPADELKKISSILDNEKSIGVTKNFVLFCKKWISEKFAFPKTYFDSSEQLKDILRGVIEVQNLDKETRFRDFSVEVYGDSKKFERLKLKMAKIFYDFDDECYIDNFNEETALEILAEKNLVKNTTYAIIKGDVTFELNGIIINLKQLGYEFCLSDKMINDVVFIKTGAKKVVTIENLTTFYDFNEKDCIVLYLGGFHNAVKRKLVEKLHKCYPELLYLHFGDIDAGGISILKHLRSKTGVEFISYKMNIETLTEYKEYWRKLTDNDRKRLKKLIDEEFSELINYMLINDCKLEQEAIKLYKNHFIE